MHHLALSAEPKLDYPVLFLVPVIRKDEILRHYVAPYSLDPEDIMVVDLYRDPGKKKTAVADMKAYVQNELVPVLSDLNVQYIVCADAEYFKVLTKSGKADANLGAALPCEFGNQVVLYVPNYQQVFYDPPKVTNKIRQGIEALKAARLGSYVAPGTGIIKFAAYPQTYDDIHGWLVKLLEMDMPLTIDIEAFDLKHHKAGIGTISFSWSDHEGIAFPVDYQPIPGATEAPFGTNERNEPVRALLKEFFQLFKQKGIYHRASFDVYVLIYQLFMQDILDTEGLLEGMDVLLRDWDDTILISYLAINSCAGNELGLKVLAQEHAGNWAVDDITDIRKIPLDQLLQYNLVDTLSTWYVYKKYRPIMLVDEQEHIYETLFKPALKDIIQMQLTGMPVYMPRVLEVEKELHDHTLAVQASMAASPVVQEFNQRLQDRAWQKDYEDRRNKAKNPDKILYKERAAFNGVEFNPNSPPQLQDLLFEMLGLPVLSLTQSKQPSTDGDTLKDLVNHTSDPVVKAFLDDLVIYKGIDKILTSFIPAMKDAALGPDGWHYLFGNFNLGGTVSGRLSSSDPNLQNLPANVTVKIGEIKLHLGKLIKSCFQAPPGWLFCGLDFASLEDRISALTTKDPNKLKVYQDGFDGHSLRAHAYFADQMPDIQVSHGRRVFEVVTGEEKIIVFEGDEIETPNGQIMKIEDYVSTIEIC